MLIMKFNLNSKSIACKIRAYKLTCTVSTLILICVWYASTKAHLMILSAALIEDEFVMLEEGYVVRGPAVSAELLAAHVGRLNAERRERNVEAFARDPAAPVLAVQAGLGAARLQRLLLALANVRGIDASLLVVSHSFYDDQLNTLVRSVRFCRVLQVFYPYSIQLFPDSFPGVDPADCTADRSTVNHFCVPRDAESAEHKQHWWWTAHFLFNHHVAGTSDRLVLFLQEDDYVAPDLLHVLQYAQRALAYHPDAEVISLGKMFTNNPDFAALAVDPWRPPYDRGLAFNRSTWRKVEALAARYCTYDDSSWSYSLLNVFAGLPRGHATMVASAAPRVLAVRGGSARAAAERARLLYPPAVLFPARVRSVVLAAPSGRVEARMRAPPHGNGGWSDPRDQLLCLDPFLMTTTNGVLYTSTPTRNDDNTTLLPYSTMPI